MTPCAVIISILNFLKSEAFRSTDDLPWIGFVEYSHRWSLPTVTHDPEQKFQIKLQLQPHDFTYYLLHVASSTDIDSKKQQQSHLPLFSDLIIVQQEVRFDLDATS
jgi:hypothetical protein